MTNIAFVHTEPKFVAGPATLFKNLYKWNELSYQSNIKFFVYDGLGRGYSNNLVNYEYTQLTNDFSPLDDFNCILISPLHSLTQYHQDSLDYIKGLLVYCKLNNKKIKLITHYSVNWWSAEAKKEFGELLEGTDVELFSLSETFTLDFLDNIKKIPVKNYFYTLIPALTNVSFNSSPLDKTENSVAIISRATNNRAYRHISELVKNKDYLWRICLGIPEELNETTKTIKELSFQDNVELYFNIGDSQIINRILATSEFYLAGCYYDHHYDTDKINAFDNTVIEAIMAYCEVISTKEYDLFIKHIGGNINISTYEKTATAAEIMSLIKSKVYNPSSASRNLNYLRDYCKNQPEVDISQLVKG